MIAPEPRSSMCGIVKRDISQVPRTLTAIAQVEVLGRGLPGGAHRQHAGVVEEDVDPPELGDRGVDRPPAVVLRGDVSPDGAKLQTRVGGLGHDGVERLLPAPA